MTDAQKRILFAVIGALFITLIYAAIIHFAGLTVGVLVYIFSHSAATMIKDTE